MFLKVEHEKKAGLNFSAKHGEKLARNVDNAIERVKTVIANTRAHMNVFPFKFYVIFFSYHVFFYFEKQNIAKLVAFMNNEKINTKIVEYDGTPATTASLDDVPLVDVQFKNGCKYVYIPNHAMFYTFQGEKSEDAHNPSTPIEPEYSSGDGTLLIIDLNQPKSVKITCFVIIFTFLIRSCTNDDGSILFPSTSDRSNRYQQCSGSSDAESPTVPPRIPLR